VRQEEIWRGRENLFAKKARKGANYILRKEGGKAVVNWPNCLLEEQAGVGQVHRGKNQTKKRRRASKNKK